MLRYDTFMALALASTRRTIRYGPSGTRDAHERIANVRTIVGGKLADPAPSQGQSRLIFESGLLPIPDREWQKAPHAGRGVTGEICIEPNCRGVIVTADGWLTMASRQAETVLAAAHALADAEGDILPQDRREIAFCPIDDVEFALQFGSGDSFLEACNEIAAGEMMSGPEPRSRRGIQGRKK